MNSFLLTTQPLDFICFDKSRQQFILDENELDKIPVSQLLLKERRYIALQRVGWDKNQQPLYLYDIVMNEDEKCFYIDSAESILYLRSFDNPVNTLHFYPELTAMFFLKMGSMLLTITQHSQKQSFL